ncbi:MAG: AI-2E family transporter, partial [Nanoarchaeota archaeon]|nr:AI-2E family transporter [Nanoarchaeota archaeon]
YPVYKMILRVVREKNISAIILVLLLLFLIFLPIWFLFPLVVRQLLSSYSYLQQADILTPLRAIFPQASSADMSAIANTFISNSLNAVFSQFSSFLLDLPIILLQLTVILFVFFFALRDAEKLKQYIKGLSPFSAELEKSLSSQFKEITNSVVYGHVIVGVIQGILTGAGLLIFGVPNALLLTVLAILASVMPVIGAWLIWLPAGVYLLTSGHTGAGIGLVLYGAVFISWIDNVIRPYIVSRRTNVSSGIVLIGMIGGLIVFGLMGLVLGPLILAYLLVILNAYKDKRLLEFIQTK